MKERIKKKIDAFLSWAKASDPEAMKFPMLLYSFSWLIGLCVGGAKQLAYSETIWEIIGNAVGCFFIGFIFSALIFSAVRTICTFKTDGKQDPTNAKMVFEIIVFLIVITFFAICLIKK